MWITRALATACLLAAILAASACPHPPPNPGQIVVSCTMDAVKDPAVIARVMDALAQPDFRAKIAGIIATIPGVTGEVVACIIRSYLGQMGADPARAQQYERGRAYLREHGYEGA